MKRIFLLTGIVLIIVCLSFRKTAPEQNWIRINQLGYTPAGIKVAVWCSKENVLPTAVDLIDASTQQTVYTIKNLQAFGAYGPFNQSSRIRFTAFDTPGRYYLKAGNTVSPVFTINNDVYKGSADFCLRYMRQQRTLFNPYLKDSCHTRDGYTLYGPMPDSTYADVGGGWHDASDYLQYSTTSANATWHLLAAYQQYGHVFTDTKKANGLDGKNNIPDILDEAKWGIDWLMKMNPSDHIMFNQIGDDRDHMKMRIPKEDTNYYGRGIERPVYFVSGKPQVRGKFMNATTGAASTAGKFASVFALASMVYEKKDVVLSKKLYKKSLAAYAYGKKMPGVAQTASVKSPYIYAEGNWTDDMELAAANIYWSNPSKNTTLLKEAYAYAKQEPVTPWLGKDTAHHYEWYPFINLGHMMLGYTLPKQQRDTIHDFYETGIKAVWNKAKQNAFYRGVPFIWCSNNLTTSFAIQCMAYRKMTGDDSYAELEQANIDWLFGCNPWGTSMVYGLPSQGDTPVDPHSAFTHLKQYPIDGGLVDGPVYTAIYKNLIGIKLNEPDEYAAFQSDLAVYHDDYGDYSTNEPTMDGTASLIYLLAAKEDESKPIPPGWHAGPHLVWPSNVVVQDRAMVRADTTEKKIALVFTADEYAEGLPFIQQTLQEQNIKGSFFFTGRLYRNKQYQPLIKQLFQQQHYLGAHSDQHILYNDWKNRDSMLVTRDSLEKDYQRNITAMKQLGVYPANRLPYFIPPYEWWNKRIGKWFAEMGVRLFSFTPGTRTNADYTWPEMGTAYKSREELMQLLRDFEVKHTLNGAILLVHAGTDPRRKDKLYKLLPELIQELKTKGYSFNKIDHL